MITLQKNDILLFQGDSITHGGRVQSTSDMNHIMGHGYQSILASRIGLDNWERRPEIRNRGVSGDTVAKMLARWEADTLGLRPTVLSILIGTNDCGFCYSGIGPDADMFEKEYRFLLDYTLDRLPRLHLILCEPFRFYSPLASMDPAVRERDEWNMLHGFGSSRRIITLFLCPLPQFWRRMRKPRRQINSSGTASIRLMLVMNFWRVPGMTS